MVMSLLNQQKLMSKLMYADDSTETRVRRAMRGKPANRDFATVLFQSAAITDYLQDFAATSTSLEMPVLVLSGREDYVVGPDHYKSFHFPHQQVVVLPGKHFVLVENPKETTQAIKAFVRKLPRKG